MTDCWLETRDMKYLGGDELGAALEAAAALSASPEYRAAVGLIIDQRSWLYRHGFRRAIDVEFDEEGRLLAYVDWAEVDTTTAVSTGELQVMEFARSLAGIAGISALGNLLADLDDCNAARVRRAFERVVRERGESRALFSR